MSVLQTLINREMSPVEVGVEMDLHQDFRLLTPTSRLRRPGALLYGYPIEVQLLQEFGSLVDKRSQYIFRLIERIIGDDVIAMKDYLMRLTSQVQLIVLNRHEYWHSCSR